MQYFPEIEPYEQGFLPVSKTHKLYYEVCGNPKGIPVMFIHGGPGGGCSERHRRYFNPNKYKIILHDQRGSHRSIPFASVKENTTPDLVNDIKKLMKHLHIEKAFFVGGSWGSTLTLAFGIKYPKLVQAMLIWGIFLPTKKELDWFYQGGIQRFYPEAWERFVSFVPQKNRNNIVKYYAKKMRDGNYEEQENYAREFSLFEMSMMQLKNNTQQAEKKMDPAIYKALAPLETHYFLNNCFLPKNYILKNGKKLHDIPTHLVHGRYDMVCSPQGAYELHKQIPQSKLTFATSGHSTRDKKLLHVIMKELEEYWKKPQQWP
jgi:proline iminopeptidase